MNKPELLPTGEFTPVIDVAGFLTEGEVRCGSPLLSSSGMLWVVVAACILRLRTICPCSSCSYHVVVQQALAPHEQLLCCVPQERRIRDRVEALEADTGVKLRVLAQNYPQVGAGQLAVAPCRPARSHASLPVVVSWCWCKDAGRVEPV